MLHGRGEAGSMWPFAGREKELAAIRRAMSAGATGVVISGDFGVGKTRLALEALREAESAGACVFWTRATRSAAGIPFGALSVLDSESDLASASAQDLTRAIRQAAAGRPIVLGVDDAQRLDGASAAFLLQAAERGLVSVVVTVRPGEPCPDAVTALWKDAGSVRIDVPVMSEDQVSELVEVALGGPLQDDARRWVAATSAGNLLYAQQLVQGALDSGSLVQRDGAWRLAGPPPSNPSLRELVAGRMGELSESERSGLELIAIGEPLTLAEASGLLGDELLAGLERQRLIVVTGAAAPASAVRLAHPLYGELLSSQTPAARARSHRLELAAMLSRREQPRISDPVRIATWLGEAGEPVPASVLLEAARAANASGIESGGRLAREAFDAGAGPEAAMLLAAGHYVYGRHTEAAAVLADLEGTIDDPDAAFGYLRRRATMLQWLGDQPEQALALLDRAADWWPDAGWKARVRVLGLPFRALADPPGAHAPAIEAVLAVPELGDQARRWLTRALAVDRLWEGRAAEARELMPAIPSFPLRDELDFLELTTRAVIVLAAGTDLGAVDLEMREAFHRAADAADHAAAGLTAVTVATTRYLAGRLLDARRWLGEAAAQCERQDPLDAGLLTHALQAGVRLALGEHPAAADASAQIADGSQAQVLRGNASWLARGRAWGLLARGEATRAQELLMEEAAAIAELPVQRAELLYEAMRAGRRASALAPLLEPLAERCDAPLTAAFAAHVRARSLGDADGMLGACELFHALGAGLYAAEAAAHAAAAFAAEGRQDSARRAAARSRELQPEGQGAQPFSIEGVDRASVDLTPREAEMVDLAARGMTNGEIATHLVISTRTVETHIYRAMRKLGINDRREFRSELTRLRTP